MNTKINKNTSLFMLTWPIIVELLLQMLIGNVDQMMISRYSQTSVAAIGNVNQIMTLLLITFNIITMATTILVSQFLGSNNKEKVSEIYSLATYTNLFFSIVLGSIMIIFHKPIFTLMNMPAELYQDATIYIVIVGGMIFLQGVFMSYAAIFRSNGLMKQTMIISMIINIINVVGNFIFLNGLFGLPQMGVTGVAMSSVISRSIGLIVVMWLFSKKLDAKISIKYLRPFPKETLASLLKIGVPSAGESLSYDIAQMCILAFVNTMGTYVVATRVYSTMITNISCIYSAAISSAVQIIVGHLIGAGDIDDADELVMKTLRPTVFISLVVAILLYLGSDIFFGLFTKDPAMLALGKQIMFIQIFLEVGRTFNLVIIRSMQAAGDIKYPVMIGILSMWGVAALLSYVFGIILGMGLVGVWIAMALDEIIRAILVYRRWKKGTWRGRALI
ncbi:MATE family efflux transporter [Niameybacter massiliensis]|uniref:MATE family efflux transporter n=1 Tax=Holtiella tumoricola TaxID=3018743 RepID=A0AA42DJU4_9FIRM|nr:MATE family efflux transporter [Holtiella tumoricola]MDA3730388.1 MATE family efflux transporter [Holtiella tumoricola]